MDLLCLTFHVRDARSSFTYLFAFPPFSTRKTSAFIARTNPQYYELVNDIHRHEYLTIPYSRPQSQSYSRVSGPLPSRNTPHQESERIRAISSYQCDIVLMGRSLRPLPKTVRFAIFSGGDFSATVAQNRVTGKQDCPGIFRDRNEIFFCSDRIFEGQLLGVVPRA